MSQVTAEFRRRKHRVFSLRRGWTIPQQSDSKFLLDIDTPRKIKKCFDVVHNSNEQIFQLTYWWDEHWSNYLNERCLALHALPHLLLAREDSALMTERSAIASSLVLLVQGQKRLHNWKRVGGLNMRSGVLEYRKSLSRTGYVMNITSRRRNLQIISTRVRPVTCKDIKVFNDDTQCVNSFEISQEIIRNLSKHADSSLTSWK